MKIQEQGENGKIIVISDTHFGDESQLLNQAALVDTFVDVLSKKGKVAELVLLGDILDVWMKPLTGALKDAKYFIGQVAALENIEKITYVPGNHDHQLFMDEFRGEVDRSIREGNFSNPEFMPSREYPGTTLSYLAPRPDIPFRMAYPFIVRHANGKEVVLTHGHHLDYFDNSFWWVRTYWLSRYIIRKRKKKKKSPDLQDIETANLPFYGAMSVNPWVPELVESELRFYRVLNFFGRLFRKRAGLSPTRDTLIRDNYDEIEKLLPLLGHPRPGCLVFGHTHRPGVGKTPDSGITVINTGSWLEADTDALNMTWAEIDYDAKLYRLIGKKVELMYSEGI
ncbi:MAG: metallophosphoesterase family protein [Actinobacteria bacterium]|nr:metallophosphoesterase family protein [Actinomycetota bacterium]